MNSSSLIWVDPHRALIEPDSLAPAPGAELTSVVQKGDVFAGKKCSQGKSCIIVDTQDMDVTHALSV